MKLDLLFQWEAAPAAPKYKIVHKTSDSRLAPTDYWDQSQETSASLEMQVLHLLSQMYSATMDLLSFNLEEQSNVEAHPKNAVLIPSSVTGMLKEERDD